MKARSHARYQLYRKASLRARSCLILEKAGRNGGSAPTSGMAETGENSLNAKMGLVFGFSMQVFL